MRGSRHLGAVLCITAFALVAVPTLVRLATEVWSSDQQGHGPIVVALGAWLIWRAKLEPPKTQPQNSGSILLISIGCAVYSIGRSQDINILEAGALLAIFAGILSKIFGWQELKKAWFAIAFLCFAIPLPGIIVDTITQPMKLAVSGVAAAALQEFSLPISRSGVIIYIGQYQLLVADACAGLNTLFTLEALGLLYLNITGTHHTARNIGLAILIVPISFFANVVRVCTLALVTYFYGDEAGQGFIHEFSGMVLFMTALIFLILTDSLLRATIGKFNNAENNRPKAL